MKKAIYLFSGVLLFTSCSAHKATISNREARKNNKEIQKENREAIANYVPLTSQQYIERYKAIAIQEMNLYHIPASITLAQGLFESGSGNGELARVANNHFGIKCTYDWRGESYYRDDDHANDCFRVYDRPEDSFRDHSLFLKRKNYTRLFSLNITDYKAWSYGLKQAGYATNPNYATLLINIIEKYQLYQYDGPQSKTNKPDTLLALQTATTTLADTSAQTTSGGKTYTVKQGDTLYNISKRFGLTVDDLKTINSLAGNTIKIGQVLIVVKP
jgi:flagellum-specific peptidoglycan hydrolase FlgJ